MNTSKGIVTTVSALVAALGGTKRAAEKLGTTPQSISNWKAAGKLPTDKYLAQREILAKLRVRTSDVLW